MLAEMEQLPDRLKSILAVNEEVARLTERYRYMRDCVVIGRGYNYATAFELALKLKELTYTHCRTLQFCRLSARAVGADRTWLSGPRGRAQRRHAAGDASTS